MTYKQAVKALAAGTPATLTATRKLPMVATVAKMFDRTPNQVARAVIYRRSVLR